MSLEVGYHFQDDTYTGPELGAATFLDVGGWGSAQHARQRMCRLYATGRPDPRELAAKASEWHQRGAQRIQILNEPNLEDVEHFGGGPDDYAEDFARVAAIVPGVRCYYGGMSPGVRGWRDWYTSPVARRVIATHAAGLCVHAYGGLEQIKEVIRWVRDQYPGTPLWLGEFNPGAGNTFDLDAWARTVLAPLCDWLSTIPEVEAATYFSWVWDESPRLPSSIDARGTAIERLIRAWLPPVAASPSPSPTPPGTGSTTPAAQPTGRSGTMIRGIDVSNHQGPAIDWDAVAASGRAFAWMKASEDPAYRDPHFARNWAECKRVGMTRGCYHYAQPDKADPDESLSLLEDMLAGVGGLQEGDLVALDIEAGEGPLRSWVSRWCAACEESLGVVPIIYSGHWFMEPHGLEHPSLGRYPLWYASYQEEPPPAPTGWDRLTFWQFTAHGTVPGVAGDCDENLFYGSLEDLRRLGQGGAPVFDIVGVRDRLWSEAEALERNGYPWLGTGVKALVATSKGEH